MAVTFNTYSGLNNAVQQWRARVGDPVLAANFDNFLANTQRRIDYGYATEEPGNPLRSDPLRIVEMETANLNLSWTTGTVAQPTGFLELISIRNNSDSRPIDVVAQRTLDGYGVNTIGRLGLLAISGQNFRLLDAPSVSATIAVTLRYYQTLGVPTVSTPGTLLMNYPDVYLYGCLLESCIMEQDDEAAQKYLSLYNASVQGLNARTQRITASAVPKIRPRFGMTP